MLVDGFMLVGYACGISLHIIKKVIFLLLLLFHCCLIVISFVLSLNWPDPCRFLGFGEPIPIFLILQLKSCFT